MIAVMAASLTCRTALSTRRPAPAPARGRASSRPKWSLALMLKTPWAPATSRSASMGVAQALRKAGVPGLPALRAAGTAFRSACRRRRRRRRRTTRCPGRTWPRRALMYSSAGFLEGCESGSWAATATGPIGRMPPSTALPPTFRTLCWPPRGSGRSGPCPRSASVVGAAPPGAGAGDHHRVGLGRHQLEHLAAHRGVGAVVALDGGQPMPAASVAAVICLSQSSP